jgi:hypothetical protein
MQTYSLFFMKPIEFATSMCVYVTLEKLGEKQSLA